MTVRAPRVRADFSRGSIFNRDGRLVASTAQEGLMRVGDRRGRVARFDRYAAKRPLR
jgi:acyl-CoA thioesterase